MDGLCPNICHTVGLTGENLNAVALENKIIKFDKPIYIGTYTFKLHFYNTFIITFIIYRICSDCNFKNINVWVLLWRYAEAL